MATLVHDEFHEPSGYQLTNEIETITKVMPGLLPAELYLFILLLLFKDNIGGK